MSRATQGEPLRHCAYCGTWIGGMGEVCRDCSDLPRIERPAELALPVCPDCGDYAEGSTCRTCGAGIYAKSDGSIHRRKLPGSKRWLRVV